MLFVPGLALALGWPKTVAGAIALFSSMLATAIFLIVGALYWRGVDRRLKGLGQHALQKALAAADGLERPGLAATILAIVATIVVIVSEGFTATSIAAALLTFLAVLEYVNYYRRQLQYFDNLADLRRLFTSGRLRRARLARDLEAFRARRVSAPYR